MNDETFDRIARNLEDGIIHLEDADALVAALRWHREMRAACLTVAQQVGPTGQPTREQWVSVVAWQLGLPLDDRKHAPLCPANHYHKQRIPSGRCTCRAPARENA